MEGQLDDRCKTVKLSLSVSWVCRPWLDQKSFPFLNQKCLPSPAGSTSDIMTSDHSPVFATFEAGVTSQFVSKNGKSWVVSIPLFSTKMGGFGHSSSGYSGQSSVLEEGSSFQTSPQSVGRVSSHPNHITVSVQSIFLLSLANMTAC